MRRRKVHPSRVLHIVFIVVLCLCSYTPLYAGDPHSAYYSPDTDKLLWFIHSSDTHIGTRGTVDTTNLTWLVGTANTAINPSFIVVSGDLTNCTNGNWLDYPDGPYQTEWDSYKNILSNAGVNASFYFDIPGNHDAYNDATFAYYRANSIQGRATGTTQVSWTRTGAWGKHHFLGIATPDNTGAAFSIFPPYGDNPGLDSSELSFISNQLTANQDANITMIFGHHPLAATGDSTDTYLNYGKAQFVSLMNNYGASLYGYGHTHASSQAFYSATMTEGVFYFNVSALGKDSPNQYAVTAIDCNGISSVIRTVGSWPVVLITAPMDRRLGGIVNPYAYAVPKANSNPIRALVFDPASVTQVHFRINSGTWQPMTVAPGNSRLWQGVWNASALAEGEYTIEVQATTGSGTTSHTITTYVQLMAPPAPAVLDATSITTAGFTANWTGVSGASGYRLDVAADGAFTSFVTGYNDLDVGNAGSYPVTGLSSGTPYYYRVRAYNAAGTSINSNTVYVTTNTVTYTLTLTATGNGVIHSSPGSDMACRAATCPVAYPAGTTVTLTPVADEDNTFGNWSTCEVPSYPSCHITMDTDKSITGSFWDYCQCFLLQRFGLQPQ
jgi:hypothetical protein